MKIKIVGSSVGAGGRRQYLMSFLVNDAIAIDAGCIGFISPISVQSRIRHVFVSHSHIDHWASLPIFLDNVHANGLQCPIVYGNQVTLECLQNDLLNGRVWPDLVELSKGEKPFLEPQVIVGGQTIETDDLNVTPVDLDHVVPTCGFIVDDGQSCVAFVSDTGPTQEMWQRLNETRNLNAVFLEASFPNSMQWLADKSMHLTPNSFRTELQKLEAVVPIVAIHIKPAYHDQIVNELGSLGIATLQIGEPETEYEF